MHHNMVQAYNALNNPSLTPAYARRKALAYLLNALWLPPGIHDFDYQCVILAIHILELPSYNAPRRNEGTRRLLRNYFSLAYPQEQ